MEKEPIPTPGEIWKILREVARGQKETREQMQETDRRMQETDRRIQETDRILRESKEETNRILRESKQETERQIKENHLLIKQIDSRWGNQWGILVEALTEGSLVEVFKERGIDVKRTIPNHVGHYQNKEREFDAIAIDGKELVVVEAKSHFILEDVDYFLETLKDFKKYCSEFSNWMVFGGVACLRGKQKVLEYAEKQGLFVLRVKGKNAIMLNEKKFKPKAF